MLTRARSVVLVLAGLTLAACGNVHPGAAAVIDDHTISMKTLDETAKFYCVDNLLAAKQNGAEPSGDNSEIRRQAVTTLAALVVARELADQAGVAPKPATYEVPDSAHDQIAAKYKGIDLDVAVKSIEDYQELGAIATALGEKSTGQSRTETNASQLVQAGEAEIIKAFKDHDVEFAPRFGLSGTIKQIASTGSLSVASAGSDAGDLDQLPAAQRCS